MRLRIIGNKRGFVIYLSFFVVMMLLYAYSFSNAVGLSTTASLQKTVLDSFDHRDSPCLKH